MRPQPGFSIVIRIQGPILVSVLEPKFFFTRPKLFSIYIYKMGFRLGFPTGRDSTTFRDNGTEVSSLSRDKGTTGQAQNLAKGRDGPGQLKSGTGRAGTAKIRDGTWGKTRQSRKGHPKIGKGCSKTEKHVLKQEKCSKTGNWSSKKSGIFSEKGQRDMGLQITK